MIPHMLLRCTFAIVLLVPLCRSFGADQPTRRTEEKVLYDDGSLRFRVPLNAQGQRQGEFIEFYRGGKKIQQQVRYENGLRTGVRKLFDLNHQTIAEDFWINGVLVLPKTMRLIEAERERLLKEAVTYVEKMPKPSNPNAPRAQVLARALGKMNCFRYLADVPADITFDDQFINLCQSAAELLVSVGHLTHTPERPAGFDKTAYDLGREGCGHSNIFQSSAGANAVDSLDGYMNDSDTRNIDRLGHRRWILNPTMCKTGFGDSGNFSAMYSFDRSRKDVPDYDFVCYPPRGLCPLNMFHPSWAWHVSMNPAKYKVSNEATLEIFEVDKSLNHVGPAAALSYSHVDRGRFGINNAIIVKPDPAIVRADVLYEVSVRGIRDAGGNPADIRYYVSFYNSAGK